jgi:hypothetical protein
LPARGHAVKWEPRAAKPTLRGGLVFLGHEKATPRFVERLASIVAGALTFLCQ